MDIYETDIHRLYDDTLVPTMKEKKCIFSLTRKEKSKKAKTITF